MTHISFEWIEKYRRGELTQEERINFEEQLKTDAEFRKKVEEYETVSNLLESVFNKTEEQLSLEGYLSAKQEEYFGKKEESRERKQRMPLLMAIAAALLTLLIWSPWRHNYIRQYGQVEMTSTVVRGDNDQSDMEKATAYFNDQKYEKAIPLFDRILLENPEDMSSVYYRGMAYLNLKELEEARSDLGKVYEGQSIFKYDAAFYLGISYLQEKNKKEAEKWLGRVPEGGDKYEEAQKIMSKF